MLENYLKGLDDFILAADEIVELEIIRRAIYDTVLEKVLNYRYRVHFFDGSMIELAERLAQDRNIITRTKYRFHWQTGDGSLIKRWDNAKHHPNISTFPHHLHDGAEDNIIPHNEPNGMEILLKVINELKN